MKISLTKHDVAIFSRLKIRKAWGRRSTIAYRTAVLNPETVDWQRMGSEILNSAARRGQRVIPKLRQRNGQ